MAQKLWYIPQKLWLDTHPDTSIYGRIDIKYNMILYG
jgi:hypothetical protein